MTQDEIIEMARKAWISNKEAQLILEFKEAYISCTYLKDLEAFAKLVAAKEREACANVCDVLAYHPEFASDATKLAAQAIRNRG